MNIVFMGTPDFAVPSLAEIISSGHNVLRVYTQPPRRSGRGIVLDGVLLHDAELGQLVRLQAGQRGATAAGGWEHCAVDGAVE